MSDCPSKECQKNVERLRRTLFGSDGLHGVAGYVKALVPKKWLWIGFVIVGLPLLMTGLKVWSGQEADHLRYAPLAEQSALRARMDVTDERYAYICTTLERLEKAQNEIKRELKLMCQGAPQ